MSFKGIIICRPTRIGLWLLERQAIFNRHLIKENSYGCRQIHSQAAADELSLYAQAADPDTLLEEKGCLEQHGPDAPSRFSRKGGIVSKSWFSGRLKRQEFFWQWLALHAYAAVLALKALTLRTHDLAPLLVLGLLSFWSLAYGLGILCRRLRDAGRSPRLCLLMFVPLQRLQAPGRRCRLALQGAECQAQGLAGAQGDGRAVRG